MDCAGLHPFIGARFHPLVRAGFHPFFKDLSAVSQDVLLESTFQVGEIIAEGA